MAKYYGESGQVRVVFDADNATEAAVKSFLRSMSTTLGREIMRGILGAIKKR